jgi:CTP synthase
VAFEQCGAASIPKYIFVTGGVVSSIGKGIATASIGRILKSRGVSVSVQKLDPYLNVDPGTMSPYQHGEVFVTEDGAETDLDLGHYERFIDLDLTRDSSVTAGQVYKTILEKERKGDFLGGTIQVVPHVTNEIKERIRRVASSSDADVVICEVGGTVGDIESLPFLEAIRQVRNEVGRDNAFFIHVTLMPYISGTAELKTKPTQHSVKELRSIGIQPDAILCRSDYPISDDLKAKIALFCDVEKRAVIPALTESTIYQVPISLQEAGLGELLIERLNLHAEDRDLATWRGLVDRIKSPRESVNIALVGKYVELQDSYLSVREALVHAGIANDTRVNLSWIPAEDIERDGPEPYLATADGVVVPGGFGNRGIEGMISTVRYARENGIPYLGLCLGMQVMVIEFARYTLGTDDCNSTEFNESTQHPVIDLMPDQRGHENLKGGTMRLGRYECHLTPGTRAWAAYGQDVVTERHRHRFEFNNNYRSALTENGLVLSGLSPDGSLVEISEVRDHPWMVGSQFHPEFKSRLDKPHPLFRDFVLAALTTVRDGSQVRMKLDTAQPEPVFVPRH